MSSVNSQPPTRHEKRFTLLECLVYISVLFVVLGTAYSVFDRLQDSSRGLARNAQDIARALRTGERWREDVSAANGPIQLEQSSGLQVLQIPTKQGTIRYEFSTNSVTRLAGKPRKGTVLIGVAHSTLHLDQRNFVKLFRWELELSTRRKSPRLKPLFTFTAIPPATAFP